MHETLHLLMSLCVGLKGQQGRTSDNLDMVVAFLQKAPNCQSEPLVAPILLTEAQDQMYVPAQCDDRYGYAVRMVR